MDRFYNISSMYQADQNQGLGQGAGFFAVGSPMTSPMVLAMTDTKKFPPNKKENLTGINS